MQSPKALSAASNAFWDGSQQSKHAWAFAWLAHCPPPAGAGSVGSDDWLGFYELVLPGFAGVPSSSSSFWFCADVGLFVLPVGDSDEHAKRTRARPERVRTVNRIVNRGSAPSDPRTDHRETPHFGG